MKTRVDVIDAEETLGAIMAVFLDASMAAAEAFRDDQWHPRESERIHDSSC